MSPLAETGAGFPRAAAAADLAALEALDSEASANSFGSTHLQRYCAGTGTNRALLWQVAGEIAGMLLYSTVLDEGSIDSVAVRGDHRRAGIGSRLLSAALEEMRAAGIRRCLLEVRASNTAARALYAGHGFAVDGVRAEYYPTPGGREDAVLMSREL